MKWISLFLISSLSLVGASCATAKSQKAAGQLYTFESDGSGFHTKNFFYDNGQEVVVFDAQFTPAIAEQAIAFLRTKTQNPISYVVVTHPNPDKFNGANVFQKVGAKVVASRSTADAISGVHAYKKYFFVKVAKMFTEETYPAEAQIDITFVGKYDLRLGNGETIKLQELSRPGVSSTQTVAHVASVNALFVGDLVHHKAHAWLEGGIVNGKATPSIHGWIADLKELKNLSDDSTLVYGGRGEAGKVNQVVSAQITYLEKADAIVKAAVKQQGAKVLPEEIQAQLEKVFPDYALGYLVKYGAYGLINSRL